MNKIRVLTAILLLMLLALPTAMRAADTFSINPVNIVPGTEKTISLSLSNSQQYYGFQTDLVLPEGLSVVTKAEGSLDMTLTDRAASSFTLSANEVSTGTIRMVCFSGQHVPFTGSSGVLVKIKLKASADFRGGQLVLTNTIFSNSQNADVRLANSKITVATKEVNTLSIEDATIDAGEGKFIPVILNNETDFTAFQFDVNLPEGLSVDFNLTKKAERCTSGHQLSHNQLSNGKVRFVCYSTNNDILKGNSGAILNLWIKAAKGATGNKQVKIDNIVFSSANATTYRLDPCTSNVVIKYTPVTSIALDRQSASILIDDTLRLHASVLPADASNKAVVWSSSNADVATVDANGLITAKKYGNCVIAVQSSDGNVKAVCNIQVNKWPLKVVVNNATRMYGEENPQFSFSYTGFQGNDNEKSLLKLPVAATSASAQSAVGNYDISVSGAESDKYEMSYANGTLTVTKAPLTISAGNYTKKQGDPMPEFKASYEGFKNDENENVLTTKPIFSTDANENSDPGEYEVKVSGAEAQNYDFNYVNGKLIITNKEKKHQTITWNQNIQATVGQTVEMTATASSGLPVTYTFYLAGGGSGWPWSDIDGNRITFKEVGARIIIAHQEGDDDYEAAEPDTMYFNVLSADEADGLMYIDGLYYKYTDDSKSALKVVRGYKSYMGDIVVPLTANGLPVVSLGDFAFYTSDKLNSVVIGDNVKEYGSEALSNSYNIRSITFPRSCTDLPAWLCNGSRGIKEIHCRSVIPYFVSKNVFNLEDDFYQNCTLYVPKGTADAYKTSELWGRFANIVEEDTVLSKVDAPVISTDNDMLNISCDTYGATIYYTLDGTEPSEDSRVYSEPVSLSGSCYIKTFAKKEGLANSDVVNGEYHNSQYPDIIKVGDVFTANIINNGVDSLLMYFKVLSVYPFEAELEAKANYVQGWTNEYNIFGDLEVPAEVTYAGVQFKVGSIGYSSLSYCGHTNHLKLNEGLETIKGSAFRYINNIKELVIPNSVKRIESAFITECHSLKTITLGTGLLSFGSDAFWLVDGLRYIYSLNPVPPTFDDPNNAFDSTPVDKITLYVPKGSKTAYENAPGWSLFAGRIVEIDPTGIVGVTADGLSITVSNHRLHIEGAQPGSVMSVYDLSGNKCMSVKLTSGSEDIDCHVPTGVYVVRVGGASKKVVL